MKYILFPIHFIYVSWVILLFIATMLVSFVFLMIGRLFPQPFAHHYSNVILRSWSTVWAWLIFIPMFRHGWKKEYGKGAKIFVTNHNSYLDTVISYALNGNWIKTLAKKELLKVPIMGPIFLTSGIMVDRSSAESRKASFERMVAAVEEGTAIMIFPEGTQNRTDQPIQKFYDGAFRLAIHTGTPIIPIVTTNTRRLMPQAKIWKTVPGICRQYFLEPVPTAGLTEEDLPELREKVREIIRSKFVDLEPGTRWK